LKGHANQILGSRGEELAAAHLQATGYRILERNFRSRGGEVDIVARDRDGTIVFVEVKTRSNLVFGLPQLAVTSRKQRQIAKGALTWLSRNHGHDQSARFDVIAVLLHDDKNFQLEHIVNAFDLAY
jgi:putative endonuclease